MILFHITLTSLSTLVLCSIALGQVDWSLIGWYWAVLVGKNVVELVRDWAAVKMIMKEKEGHE